MRLRLIGCTADVWSGAVHKRGTSIASRPASGARVVQKKAFVKSVLQLRVEMNTGVFVISYQYKNPERSVTKVGYLPAGGL